MSDVMTIRRMDIDIDEEADYPDEYQISGEKPVKKEVGFSDFIIVDNLPIVGDDKYSKLLSVIRKLFSQTGTVKTAYMPKKNGKTQGFAFIQFASPQEAEFAISQCNGYVLDKKHILKANPYKDFDFYANTQEEFVPMELPPYKPKDNLWWWLIEDEKEGPARDQYVIRYENKTEIFWNDPYRTRPLSIHCKEQMTATYITWSPYGTYLGTFHKQGVILWGGPEWEKVMKFSHADVKLLDFSPKENYLVTVSQYTPENPNSIIIWDARSSQKKRAFEGTATQHWPVFQWSYDEKFFARIGEKGISVYETPGMGLKDKKTFNIPGVRAFCWSPTDHTIACWVPESADKPARVLLINVPDRKILRSHNLFKVQDCNLHWSTNGDYLSVKVDRYIGKKKVKKAETKQQEKERANKVVVCFEFFRVREKDIPIESLEEMKDQVLAFAWEPKGKRFAIIHTKVVNKNSVSFYTMETSEGKKEVQKLKQLDNRVANHLFWSPEGSDIVLAGFGSAGGGLEFYNVDQMESIRTDKHTMVTDLAWDPTGRFLATSTSYWRYQLDNGWTIWTFQGKQICKVTKDKFFQFAWRPRPPTLLSEEKQEEIKKNIKVYAKKYKEQDNKRKMAAWEKYMTKRREAIDSFNERRERRKQELAELRQKNQKKNKYDSDEDEWTEVEEEVTELIEEDVEIVEVLEYSDDDDQNDNDDSDHDSD
eukprot:CAMPEP_0174261634 /NCGR_PEP_ID=MMETSP0439-20130205/11667_1 /TAXON_ID=0 /ORGANISM="Stereomyxa ramosa, Strain Chinc5" /LENGTH=705 /DNA_ID=CAMNT_0015346141 /DNA_START=76 /DNA_END=2193 /DNA_ORIENTATION=+